MLQSTIIKTPIGLLKITANGDLLTACHFVDTDNHVKSNSLILEEAQKQLTAYFQGQLKKFDLPLSPDGTEFQKKVWHALQTIPYGETRSYQTIASNIDNAKAARAIGNANGKNPLCIFIPCHRVICASGDIGGYSGGIHYKTQLLALEKKYC